MNRGQDPGAPRTLSRRSIVIGTAGHIDHGKSALVRALTGIDPDRLKEERERGITIDLGFAHCDIDGLNVAFVDVPGHERFVRNMLAGAGGIDAVMLVVAADESIKPQTREHFAICRLLGVRTGCVALTKADLVDEETLELARLDLGELTAGSFLEGRPVVVVSSKTGDGLPELRRAIRQIAGDSLRDLEGPARLPIDRAFSIRGFGTVVTGTLVTGTLRTSDEMILAPGGSRVKVRGLQVHGSVRATAGAGERVAVNLGGVDVSDVARGDSLLSPGSLEATRVVDARVETLSAARPLADGARVRFHQGTAEIIGRLSVAWVDGADEVRQVPSGRSAYVRIRLEQPAVLARGDRFILRAYSPPSTVAGGSVLDPAPPRGPIRTAAALDRWRAMSDPATDEGLARAVLQMVEESGNAGVTRPRLASRAGAHAQRIADSVDRAVREGRLVIVDETVLSAQAVRVLERQLTDILGAYHRREPFSEGMAREEARARVSGRVPPAVFDWMIGRLGRSGVVRAGERLALESHRAVSTAEDRSATRKIESICRDAGFTPPDLSGVARAAGLATAVTDRLVTRLIREKTLVRISGLLFHEETLSRLRDEVKRLKEEGKSGLDVRDVKQRFGLTRKHAIPLLEYLDRERITRRQGDSRVIL